MSTPNKSSAVSPALAHQKQTVHQVRLRIFWKFVAILVCLLAYILLGAIENAKESYDNALARPIVIVSDQYAIANATQPDNLNAESMASSLGSKECPPLYSQSSGQSRKDPNKGYNATLVRVCAIQGFLDGSESHERSLRRILEKKLMYQNFSDDDAIIDRLNAEILAEANLEKRALLSTEEAENRARARKIPDLSKEETWIHEALEEFFKSELPQEASAEDKKAEWDKWIKNKWKDLSADDRYASEREIATWREALARRRFSKPAPLKERELLVLHEVILQEKTDYETRTRPLKERIEAIEKDAQQQIIALYEKLKPKLPDLIAGSPGAPKELAKKNPAWRSFDLRPVLDETNGTHVIYQIFRLALMMVLGLGLIFLLLFLIRLIPPISRGTDQFIENAGEFFKRSDGGGSQLAKSLVMTVSAVGLGAAVVIGSSAAGLTAVAGDTYPGDYEERDSKREKKKRNGKRGSGDGEPGPRGEPGQKGEAGSPGSTEVPGSGVDLHQVKLLEPIVYPSPITVSGPASVNLSPDALTPIVKAITDLHATDVNSRITVIADKLITEKLKNVPKPTDCCPNDLAPRILSLESWRNTHGATPVPNLDVLINDLRTTKEAVEKLQEENLQRNQNSGGRGLLTRLFQEDKYLVTKRTVDTLRLLMRKPVPDCNSTIPFPADAATKKCCDQKPTDLAYCPNPVVEAILNQLLSMVGDPPRSESDFMKHLRSIRTARGDSIDKAIDQWKSIILKHARTAY